MPDEVFDLNAFCDIMKEYCGFSLEFLANSIFGTHLGSISSLRRILKYERPIKSLQEDQKHVDIYAANLAKAFTDEDKNSGKSLKSNCYNLFVQGLKGTPLCNKIQIVEPSQLPSDVNERTSVYKKLASAVLDEAFSATLITAIEKNRLKDVKNKDLSEQATDDLPKIAVPVVSEPTKSTNPVVVEPSKISNPQSVIDSISTLNKDETKVVFNSLMEKMRGETLEEFENEFLHNFVNGYLLSKPERTYLDLYSRTDEVFINEDNTSLTKNEHKDFTLVSNRPDNLHFSISRSYLYTGGVTDIHDINSDSRYDDRLGIFNFSYYNIEISVNGVKTDNIFQYFRIATDPDDFKYEQGSGSMIHSKIVLDQLLQSFKSNKARIHIKTFFKYNSIHSNNLYVLFRIPYPVKKYVFTCVLRDDTSKQWDVKLLPILPGYFSLESDEYSKQNFIKQDASLSSKTITITDWVTPGFGILYALEYKGLLFSK
ncbi:MAG: hypothetical protein LBT59_23375 [Clostridiales bacterium]|jgi:hypothetical protein|nr:hypothetical protein [Clostridiales bacterium]